MTYQLIGALTVPNGTSLHKLSICCYYTLKMFSYILNLKKKKHFHTEQASLGKHVP